MDDNDFRRLLNMENLKKAKAETRKAEAEANKAYAEVHKTRAETRRIRAEERTSHSKTFHNTCTAIAAVLAVGVTVYKAVKAA